MAWVRWWHRHVGHTQHWEDFGITYSQCRCSCGRRWIK